MKRRYFAAAAVLVSAVLSGCSQPMTACPAIGYVYTDAVVLDVDTDLLSTGTVTACIGTDCDVAPLIQEKDGSWVVPQEPPFSSENTIGISPGSGVRIAIYDDAGLVVRDDWYEIPYTSDTGGACPGPVTFESVPVG